MKTAACKLLTVVIIMALFTPSWAMGEKTSEPSSRCVVGGCSGELCVDSAGAAGMVSNCMYADYYACYPKFGECTVQIDGRCGWTNTEELKSCIANPPSLIIAPLDSE